MISIKLTGPSKKWHEEHSCSRKVRYGRRVTALRAINKMEDRACNPLEEYECEFCGGWHIGRKQTFLDRLMLWMWSLKH